MSSEVELSIPTIDLAELASSDRAVRMSAANAIKEGFAIYGLVYVANHGVDLALRERVFDRFVEFTNRAPAEKEKLNRPDIWYQRGWTPPNTEQAVVAGGQPSMAVADVARALQVLVQTGMAVQEDVHAVAGEIA